MREYPKAKGSVHAPLALGPLSLADGITRPGHDHTYQGGDGRLEEPAVYRNVPGVRNKPVGGIFTRAPWGDPCRLMAVGLGENLPSTH